MSDAAMTPLTLTAGYVEFDLFDGPDRTSVIIKQEVVEEHALRHPMTAREIQSYIATNFETFVDAVQRAGAFNRKTRSVIIMIDRLDQLEPEGMGLINTRR